jgi:hypothetical protein
LNAHELMIPDLTTGYRAMRGTKSTGMLQLEVYVFPNGDLEIRGVLGEDGLYSDGNVNG